MTLILRIRAQVGADGFVRVSLAEVGGWGQGRIVRVVLLERS